jgi:phospholipid/cholesterol/gamma-HCH transport system substrate-binding protein
MNVLGVRNIPCETNPAKRAATVEMCESDQQYVPLNDGNNWEGDPNATLSGQGIPQVSATVRNEGSAPGDPPPPIAATAAPPVLTPYDPATGSYIGPDGRAYTQDDLAHSQTKTWQSMLSPPQ